MHGHSVCIKSPFGWQCVFCSGGGGAACRLFPILRACLIQWCWKQIQRPPPFKIQYNSKLERLCVFLNYKRLYEWFWVYNEAACGLSIFLGQCLIQRCWNHFICPSRLCFGLITLVRLRLDSRRHDSQLVPSLGYIISAGAHPSQDHNIHWSSCETQRRTPGQLSIMQCKIVGPQNEVILHGVKNKWNGPIRKENTLWTFILWNLLWEKKKKKRTRRGDLENSTAHCTATS